MNSTNGHRCESVSILRYILGALAIAALTSAWACAHKVNVFAYVQGDKVTVEAYFSGKARMQGGGVQVFDAAGHMFKEGRTDDNGEFSFPVADIPKAAGDVRILVDAEMGHQAEYMLSAVDIPGRAPQASAPQLPTESPFGQAAPKATSAPMPAADMEKLLNEKLEPIITMLGAQQKLLLAEKNSGPSYREIIGGLGWIMGIFGVWGYMSSRSNRRG